VNVASIYQYFPGKAAIVAELRRRHGASERAAARDVLVVRRGQGLEATLRAMIARSVAAHAVAPALHRAFAERLPAQPYRDIEAADAPVFAEMRDFLERSTESLPDLEFAMWMVATTAHAAIHNGVIERPNEVETGRLVDELVVLLTRYLKRPRARVKRPTRKTR